MVEWLPLFCVLVFALFRLTLRSSSRFTVLRFCFTVLYFCFLLTVGAGVLWSGFNGFRTREKCRGCWLCLLFCAKLVLK